MKQTIKNIVPSSAKRFVRRVYENFIPSEQQNVESANSILVQAYQRIGILNYKNDRVSGEAFLLQKIIPTLISKPEPVIFDVGANVGDYTKALLDNLPTAKIHAFEPSPQTYAILTAGGSRDRVVSVMKGMGDQCGSAEFFDYSDRSSGHASLYGEVLSELHHADDIRRFKVVITTLDEYCVDRRLPSIDFIKIDTEGNELAVLRGGKQLIETGGLPIVQIEFNEMNIISRSFLKDFYNVLKGYEFFRLMPNGLLPLGAYQSCNEIFQFQNILAVRPESYPAKLLAPFLVTTLSKPPIVTP